MYGENQAEYGNKITENYKPTMDEKFFSEQDISKIRLTIKEIINKGKFKLNDFSPYIPPIIKKIRQRYIILIILKSSRKLLLCI